LLTLISIDTLSLENSKTIYVSFHSHNSFLFKAILRLGGNRYQQQCDDIKEKSFGNSDKDIVTELRNILVMVNQN
jgi:hypothetical protein